jgi:hypothetical protein
MKKFQPTLKLGLALVAAVILTIAALVWTPARGRSSAKALPPPAKISLVVTIFFGRPSNCAGFGICKITLGVGRLNTRELKGDLSLEDNGKLAIAVNGKAPDEQPTLDIDQDLPLSADIAKKLGLKSATIAKGSYSFSGGRAVLDAQLVK